MAGTWIKMLTNLHDSHKVRRLARLTGLDRFAVVGRLHRVWSWADEHTTDGVFVGEVGDIDDIAEHEGFAAALIDIEWLTENGRELLFVNFDEHNGQTAKKRAQDSSRIAQKRGCRENVASKATKTRPEKRREEKSKSSPSENKSEAPASRSQASGEKFDWSKAPESMRGDDVRNALIEWYAYRKAAKFKPWQHVTLLKTLNKYAESGGPAQLIADIENSISQGYQGIFPDKSRGSPAPKLRIHNQHQAGGNADDEFIREQLNLTGS